MLISSDSGEFVYCSIKWNISRELSIFTLPAHRVEANLKLIKLLEDYFLFTHWVNKITEINQGNKTECLAGFDCGRYHLASEACELFHTFSCTNHCDFHVPVSKMVWSYGLSRIWSWQASVSMWNFPSVLQGKVKLDYIYFDWVSIYFRTFGAF